MKKINFFLFLYILLSIPLNNLLSQNFLSSQENKLVDSKGNTVRLTGVNWFGFETNLKVPHGLWTRDCKSMLKQIKDLGFNCIRFPWSNDILLPGATINLSAFGTDPYTGVSPMNQVESTFTTPLQLLDKIVAYCQELNLKIVLDNHSRKSDNFLNEAVWYINGVSEEKWIADWVTLATRYKNNDAVIAMDLDNEPNGNYGQGSTWGNSNPLTDWNKAAERCGNAILIANPNVLIMVEGVQTYNGDSYWWGGNLKGVADYPIVISKPNKLIYSPHEYGPEVFNSSWFSDPTFPSNMTAIWDTHFDYIYTTNKAPLLVGEFGIKDAGSFNGTEGVWFDTFLAFMGTRYSWTFWCWNPNSGDTGGILDDQWANPIQWKVNKLKPYMAAEIPNGNTGPVNHTPVAVLKATPTSGQVPLTVTFDASESSDADGDALTYTWSTGGSGPITNSTFQTVGSVVVSVTVSDSKGGLSSATTSVTVIDTTIIVEPVITVSPTFAIININAVLPLTATVTPFQQVTWASANPNIATVNSSGLVTGNAEGSTIITVTTIDGKTSSQSTITVVGATSCTFGTPLSTALPSINNKTYTSVYVLGTGGPNLSNIRNFTINWDLPNKGLYQFSVNTTDGKPNWYVDLRAGASQTFASAQPSITLSGTGFTGLDGNYYAAIDNGNFVLAEKSGAYTIYFSTSTTAPVCNMSAKKSLTIYSANQNETVTIYPNPCVDGNITLQIYLDNASVISIKALNQLGQPVLNKYLGEYNAGLQTIKMKNKIPAGLYFFEIKAGDLVKFIKVRIL